MNIEFRSGANKGGQQPSQLLYLANRENALLAHTATGQVFEKTPHETSLNYDKPNRFWPKNRSYREQMTKPCLTGTRIACLELQLSSLGEPDLGPSRSLGTSQIRPAAPTTNPDQISVPPRAAAKSMCGTLGIWDNSEVA